MAKAKKTSAVSKNAYTGSGASDSGGTAPKSHDPSALQVEDYMQKPEKIAAPTWRKSKYPVSKEDFDKMKLQALKVDRSKGMTLTPNDESPDSDVEMVTSGAEVAEDAVGAYGPEALAPVLTNSFESISDTGWRPPDCTLAVGPNDVLAAVNVHLAVYSKAGALKFKWPDFASLFSAVRPAGSKIFDPKVAYDHYAGRYIALLAAVRETPKGAWILIGVSKTNNPAAGWWVWALNFNVDGSHPSNNWADFPNLGFDTQAVYITTNQFAFGGGFSYSKLRILKKSQLYAGAALTWYDFWGLKNPDGSLAFTVQPCVHFRGIGGNPPAYMVNAIWPSSNKLTMWTLVNPIAAVPGLSRVSVACRSYSLPPDGEQPGTTTPIETNDSRLLNAIYQNAGGVQRIWTCHTSKGSWSGDPVARAVIQWYEINVPTKTVVQQNFYGAAKKAYIFPAIHTDISRDAYLVFTRVGKTEFAAVRQTGRKVSDPANDLQNSTLVKAGESAYLGARWGDYFGICRDPSDLGKVWAYGEYAESSGRWGTWIYAAKL